MREGWEVKMLKEVCQIKPPKKEAKELLRENDQVSFVPMDTLGIDQKYFVPGATKKLAEVSSSYTYFKDGDVLLAKITPCFENGKLGIARELFNSVGFGSSEYIVYRASSVLTPEYLYYFLNQESFREKGKMVMTGAVGHKRIPKEFYEESTIPIPPLPEQKQIVAILDQVFAAIDKAKANIKRNIQNAKELFQSKLNEIFSQKGESWEEKRLGEIGKVQTGTTPSTKDKSNYGDYIPFVKPAHFQKDGSIDSKDSMLSKTGLEKGRLFAANSTLMVCIGATIGKTGFSGIPVSSNQQINALTPSKNYEPKLLYYALISPYVQNQIKQVGKSAQATLPIINKSKWEKLKVSVPMDRKTQELIVKKLDNLNTSLIVMAQIYSSKIHSLEELKKSLLQKAFAGELTREFEMDKALSMAAEPEERYGDG